MAGWKPCTIAEVVEDITAQTFVLPVVQRRFVWEADRIELLFDTVLKGDAFGGIMALEEQSGEVPLFESRPFSAHGEELHSTPLERLEKRTWFVIDGQQRLQSLYIGLHGCLRAGEELFFDLYSDHKALFEFRFKTIGKNLPEMVSENDDPDMREIRERCWYRVATLFDSIRRAGNSWYTVADELAERYASDDKAKAGAIRTNVNAFGNNIFSQSRLGVDSVSLNGDDDHFQKRQRVVELFRRLNDGGTRLSSYDLFASIMKGFNWKMEAFLDDILAQHEAMGLTQNNLIKLVFLLQGDARKKTECINQNDANFAVQNQDKIRDALTLTQRFLEAAKLKDYFNGGRCSFIPIHFITYYVFFKNASQSYFDNFDTSHPDFTPMRDWVFHSLLNSAFKSSRGFGWNPNTTGIARILEIMERAKGKPFPIGELLQIFKNHLHFFTTDYRPEDLDKLDRDFAFYVIYDCQRQIRDVDHIQPKSRLAERGVVPEKINSIANFQLLDLRTNRGSKNDDPFDKWLNGSSKGELNVSDRVGFLERHLIPADPTTHEIEHFDDLLVARAKLIAKKLSARFQS